jgi:hypothetical protein
MKNQPKIIQIDKNFCIKWLKEVIPKQMNRDWVALTEKEYLHFVVKKYGEVEITMFRTLFQDNEFIFEIYHGDSYGCAKNEKLIETFHIKPQEVFPEK